MNRIEFYMEALRAEAFLMNAWTLSIFTEIREEPDAWTKDPYPYRVVRKDSKVWFITKDGSLEEITDAASEGALLKFDIPLDLKPGDLVNVITPVETTVSEAFMNAAVLCYSFGSKLPYKAGSWDAGYLEDLAGKMLATDLKPGEADDPEKFYVKDLKRVSRVITGLTALNAYFVPTASPKNITFDPRMIEERNKGIAKLKELGLENDPIELAKLEKHLESIDRAWCNDYGSKFFTAAKEFNNSRKKMFTHVGYEKDFLDSNKGKYNGNSLAEGLNVDMFVETVNSAREGSYNRGRLTMLGGSGVKNAIRSSQNVRVIPGFCGTALGDVWNVREEDKKTLVGTYFLLKGKVPTEITDDNFGSLVGKKTMIASAGFCISGFTDYCSICIGKKGAARPNALPLNISDVSSDNMYKFMKKMHVSSITLTKLKFETCLME